MSNILLDTGTGELEIMEFIVEDIHYAINVLKLKGIIQIDEITPMPMNSKDIVGLSNIRGEMVPVIDLKFVLYNKTTEVFEKKLALLCEFNNTVVAFIVDYVQGIRRVKWEDISHNRVSKDTTTIGTLSIDNTIILLLDFESITIASSIGINLQSVGVESKVKDSFKDNYIVLAEDSNVIAEMITCALHEAGFNNVIRFSDGQATKEYLFSIKETLGDNFKNKASLIITDIEMPLLDGYTLTKYIKEDAILKKLPVIMFSSLITNELMHKGESVGVDVQINKPSTKELIESINLLLTRYEEEYF